MFLSAPLSADAVAFSLSRGEQRLRYETLATSSRFLLCAHTLRRLRGVVPLLHRPREHAALWSPVTGPSPRAYCCTAPSWVSSEETAQRSFNSTVAALVLPA